MHLQTVGKGVENEKLTLGLVSKYRFDDLKTL